VVQWLGRKKRVEGLVGLSVNDTRVTLAHVTRRRDDIFLEQCVRREFEGKAARDALVDLVDECGLDKADTNFLLSPADYSIYLVDAPQVPAEEMAAAIKWKIKDLLDMPVENAAIDVFPLPEDAFQGRKQMVYAVVSDRSRLEQVIDMVDRSGLTLSSIDVPEMSMRNITTQFGDDSNGLAFISLKQSGSVMNITRNGQLYLTRKINTPVGPDALLESDWEMLRDRLALEIQRSLDYFESQMGQNPVAQIMIAPRAKDTESMMNSMADALGSPVGVLDFYNEVDAPELLDTEIKGAGMMVIGAALRAGDAGGLS
jgi:MSHA biogenesis protein MshI